MNKATRVADCEDDVMNNWKTGVLVNDQFMTPIDLNRTDEVVNEGSPIKYPSWEMDFLSRIIQVIIAKGTMIPLNGSNLSRR